MILRLLHSNHQQSQHNTTQPRSHWISRWYRGCLSSSFLGHRDPKMHGTWHIWAVCHSQPRPAVTETSWPEVIIAATLLPKRIVVASGLKATMQNLNQSGRKCLWRTRSLRTSLWKLPIIWWNHLQPLRQCVAHLEYKLLTWHAAYDPSMLVREHLWRGPTLWPNCQVRLKRVAHRVGSKPPHWWLADGLLKCEAKNHLPHPRPLGPTVVLHVVVPWSNKLAITAVCNSIEQILVWKLGKCPQARTSIGIPQLEVRGLARDILTQGTGNKIFAIRTGTQWQYGLIGCQRLHKNALSIPNLDGLVHVQLFPLPGSSHQETTPPQSPLVSPRFRLHDEIPGSWCLGPKPWRIRLTTNRTNKRSMVGDEIWALSCRKTSLAVPDVVTKRYVYLWLKRMHDAVCSQVAGLLCHNFFWKAITSPWSDEICPCRSRLAMPGPKHSLQLFQKCLWFSGSKFKDRPRWR